MKKFVLSLLVLLGCSFAVEAGCGSGSGLFHRAQARRAARLSGACGSSSFSQTTTITRSVGQPQRMSATPDCGCNNCPVQQKKVETKKMPAAK